MSEPVTAVRQRPTVILNHAARLLQARDSAADADRLVQPLDLVLRRL